VSAIQLTNPLIPTHPASLCDEIEQVDFCAFVGRTWREQFTFVDREVVNGANVDTPVDLTSSTITAVFKTAVDTAVAATFTVAGTIDDAVNGIFSLSLTAAQLVPALGNTYLFFDVQIAYTGADEVMFPVVGVMYIKPTTTE